MSQRSKLLSEAKFGFSAEKAVSLAHSMAPMTVRNAFKGAFQVSGLLTEAWMAATSTRRTYFDTVNDVAGLPIAKTIIKQMSFDVLNPDKNGNAFKITAVTEDQTKRKFYQTELDRLQDAFDLNAEVRGSFVKELVNFGENALRLSVKQGEGLTGIHNDVDLLNLVALYEQGVPRRYLKYEKNDYYLYPGAGYAHFVVGSNMIRIKLENRLVSGYSLASKALSFNTMGNAATDIPEWAQNDLPDFIQIGEPLFNGYVGKVRELQLLESLVVATKLNQITQASVLGIPCDPTMHPDEVTRILREWEEKLNPPIAIDFTRSQIGVSDVIGSTGILKCVPIFGDNGDIKDLAVRANVPVDDLINAVNNFRKMITSNLGIPYSMIYGAEGEKEGNKANELRMHARYTRTLASIQLALRQGINQIVLTHFRNRGAEYENFSKKDFEVEFINSLVDISALEKLEVIDATNEIAGRCLDLVNKFYSNPVSALMANPEGIMGLMAEQLAEISSEHKLIKSVVPPELLDPDFLKTLQVTSDGSPQVQKDDPLNPNIGNDNNGPAPTHTKPSNEDVDPNDPFGVIKLHEARQKGIDPKKDRKAN